MSSSEFVETVEVAAALRGAPWPGTDAVPYPRVDPTDFDRLPLDTWTMAAVPAGVRLELVLTESVRALRIDYETATNDLGYRGDGAGTAFELWAGDKPFSRTQAHLGTHTAEVAAPAGGGSVIVYLPEGMKPRITGITAVGGPATPADPKPAWLCYGDSIAEGWSASGPALSWPMIAARAVGLDVSNLGYAGSARGEIVSAIHLAGLPADVITLSHGTNCWNRTPHSSMQVAADYAAFLDVVRQGHPEVPIIAISPLVRPDAEGSVNELGATLSDLRDAIESVVGERQAGDPLLTLITGADLIEEADLVDGVHPGDGGHRKVANAVIPPLQSAIASISG